MLSNRFEEAVRLACRLHGRQKRKGSLTPYISHPLQVAGLVLEYGGTEDEAIGALLHDAAEDAGGEPTLSLIQEQFGPEVETIVRQNSDSINDEKENKPDWQERKDTYISAVPHKSESACLVSICDKLHNARSLLSDQIEKGDVHWQVFHATKDQSLWYYRELLKAFRKRKEARLQRPIRELSTVVEQLLKAS